MSRTTREFKGKEYRQEKEKKRQKPKKFFGWTSGQHSNSTKAVPMPGKNQTWSSGADYVKYGWPMETRNPKKISEKIEREEATEEIQRAKGS
jgi:hypothetical protein